MRKPSVRVTVKVGRRQREKRFAVGTSLRVRQDWKDRMRGRLKDDQPAAAKGSFSDDVDRYLPTLADRHKLHKERAQQLEWWIRQLGTIRRSDITPAMIRTSLAELRQTRSASTCNKYRMALSHLWSTLDGKANRNPIRDVPVFAEPEAEPRNLPEALIERIFEQFAKRGMPKKGLKRAAISLAELRLRVMWKTGLSPAEIMRLELPDLRLDDAAVYVRRRMKGKGSEGMLMPLTAEGVAALAMLVAHDGLGTFSTHAVYRCWSLACRKLRETGVDAGTDRLLADARPYDLRHSFGTMVLERTQNLKLTQELMRHRSGKTTKRYVRAAVPAHLRAAMQRISAGTRQPSSS